MDSPVSNNGRGLKPVHYVRREDYVRDSPVSNNGRGLKRDVGPGIPRQAPIRPLAITGVD